MRMNGPPRIARGQLSSTYPPLMRARTTYDSLKRPKNYGTAASNSNFNSLVRARTGEREWALEAWRLQSLGRPIRWLKHVDDRTLHQAYRECLFTVYPSLMEGFGIPILESLWHGNRCVCGGNGALGEVARGGDV